MSGTVDLSGLQGNIATGYKHRCFKQLFGRIEDDVDGFRELLRELLPMVTRGSEPVDSLDVTLNVGVSHAGLAVLVPESTWSLQDAFPAYAAGMSGRAALLGDGPGVAWSSWDDRQLWLTVHAADDELLTRQVAKIEAMASSLGLRLDASLPPGSVIQRDGKRMEHFGFKDGISNPVFAGGSQLKAVEGNGKRDPKTGKWVPLATGEFLLGYPNEQGNDLLRELPGDVGPLLRDGTFAVLRVLRQDVEGFRRYTGYKQREYRTLDAAASPDLAERMMGRTRDGKALAAPESGNDFDYEGDPAGAKCPFGAHVRRANPRDEGEHRLLRRGMPYGPTLEEGPADAERGLYFIAFNASIENQFEFMQRFYMNGEADGRRATGNLNDARDPVGASGDGLRRMAIEGDAASSRSPVLLLDIPAFVTCLGGQYYLMPSITALKSLCARPRQGLRVVRSIGEAQEEARP